MRCSFSIEGLDLHEVAKPAIFEYFQQFGCLSDHIVRNKGTSRHMKADGSVDGYLISFTLTYRLLSVPEEEITDRKHYIEGVTIRCARVLVPVSAVGRKVFIKYLDKKATVQDIQESLSIFGTIESIQLSMKKDRSMNLGLCNVTFLNEESATRVLNEPSILVRNKKVKVEVFHSHSNESRSVTCQYSARDASSHDGRNSNQAGFPDEHDFIMKSGNKNTGAETSIQQMMWDTGCGPTSLSELDTALDKVITRRTSETNVKDSTERSVRSIFNLSLMPYSRYKLPANRSLDQSLIEEEVEESPRRRSSPSLEQRHGQKSEQRLNLIQLASAASSKINSANSSPVSGVSIHAIRPTKRQYSTNPPQTRQGLLKNHKHQNIRINKNRVPSLLRVRPSDLLIPM